MIDSKLRRRAFSLLAATVVVAFALLLLILATPPPLAMREPPVITTHVEDARPPRPPRRVPPITPAEPPVRDDVTRQSPQPMAAQSAPARPGERQSPVILPGRPPAQARETGAGTAPTGPQSGGAAGPPASPPAASPPPARQPSQPTRSVLRSIECQRLDPEDRPADCPPQGGRLLAAREALDAPGYNPEVGPTRTAAEFRAMRYAGWRDRCETNEGAKAQVCIPFGITPPRVKTPEELCRESGLSACVDLPPQRPEN